MISLDALGFLWFNTNQILCVYYNLSSHLRIHNSTFVLKSYEQIMVQNFFPGVNFFLITILNANVHVSIPPNQTGWFSTNTVISSQLHDLFFISLIYQFIFGDCVLIAVYHINCLPSPILSDKIPFQLLYNQVPSVTHLRIFTAYVMQQWIIPNTNLIPLLDDTSLLDIHLIIKATYYMILKKTLFLWVGASFLTKPFLLFMKQHHSHTLLFYQIWSLT